MLFKYKTTAIFLAVVFLFVIDRLLKFLALDGAILPLLGPLVQFNFSANYGIAFSLPLARNLIVIMVLLIIFYLYKLLIDSFKEKTLAKVTGFSLIITGALSNLFDRINFGYVVDYIEVRYFSILNLADVMIFCGVVTVLWKMTKKEPTKT